MEAWLEWARGPLFIFAFSFMILGLLRHLILTFWEIRKVLKRAGDKTIPYKAVFKATLKWLLPMGKMKNRLLYSLTTVVFHISIIVVPIFLAGHVALWSRGVGVSWPAIPNTAADVLTIIAIIGALALPLLRVAARDTRTLSRFQDYAIPLLIALPFASGFMMMHPAYNPFSYQSMLFIHVMSANVIFISVPLTKLSHMVLMPTTQLVSEVAWHWPPDGGSQLGKTLGKENEPI